MDKRIRVSLDANFASSEVGSALRAYGRDAPILRDLWVGMICHCKQNDTDGFVPEGEVAVLGFPYPPATTARNLKRLIEAGAVERAVKGYTVPAYIEQNGSRASTERLSAVKADGARRANHDRWHAKRGEYEPGCAYCASTDQSTGQFTETGTDQSTDVYADQYSDRSPDQYTDPAADQVDDAELFTRSTPPIVPPTAQAEDEPDDPRFTEFWGVYPLKRGKPRARKAWRQAMRKKHDPDLIITAAKAYREDPKRKPDYTAHASTWLNDERYMPEEEPDPNADGGDDYDWEA